MFFGWISRWLYGSIYNTATLEKALQTRFPEKDLFGLRVDNSHVLRHCPRVAITTTTESRCKLFTNYNRGGAQGTDYLNSLLSTWTV
jgi:hypothetical protein